MKGRQVMVAAVVLGLCGAPLAAQQQPAPADHHEGMMAMVCTMGMFPHPGMGEGMMGGQGMAMPGAGMGMQHGGMAGMQHGGMGAARPDSTPRAGQPGAMGGMQHGAMGGMQHGMGGMQGMGEMAPPVTPAMLLHHAQDIGLTSEQQAKVSELAKTSQTSCEQHLQAAAASHQGAAAALDRASPDLDAYQSGLRAAADHLVEAHMAVVKAGVEAEGLLTAEQKQKLAAAAKAMHGH